MDPTPRIRPVAEPLPPALAAAMARLMPAGTPAPQLFLAVARNEALFIHLVESGLLGPTGLLDRRTLPRALRECVILRTCVATGNDYEFNLHVQTISARMGIDAAQIDDIRTPVPRSALWTPDALAAMALVDAVVARDVGDAVFDAARAHFDDAVLVEITQLAGLYVGVAMQVALVRPAFDAYRPGAPVRARRLP